MNALNPIVFILIIHSSPALGAQVDTARISDQIERRLRHNLAGCTLLHVLGTEYRFFSRILIIFPDRITVVCYVDNTWKSVAL